MKKIILALTVVFGLSTTGIVLANELTPTQEITQVSNDKKKDKKKKKKSDAKCCSADEAKACKGEKAEVKTTSAESGNAGGLTPTAKSCCSKTAGTKSCSESKKEEKK